MTTKTRRRHTAEFQANAVRRLSNPGQSAQELADELKVTRSLLYRWRRAADTKEGPMPKKKPPPMNDPARRPQDWTTEQKLSVVLDAQGLAEEELGGFLRQRGLHGATLSDWRETVLRGAKAELGGRATSSLASRPSGSVSSSASWPARTRRWRRLSLIHI